MTLIEAEAACGELSKSSMSLVELTPQGAELLPCADAYARWLGYELVRRYDYDLRRLPERESKARASDAADSISPSRSGSSRRRGAQKTSSSRATASRASITSRSGKRRTTTSKRRASRGGR